MIELKSKTDSIFQLKIKMDEYMANGCRLGFLIDREDRKVYIYYLGNVSCKSFFDEISGMDVLPGLKLGLPIFD